MTDVFYDTEVIIEQVFNSGGYSEDNEYSELFSIMADVQPYKNDGKQQEYGIFDNAKYVMYCDNCNLQTGQRAVIDGERYIITGTVRRSLGMKAYLEREVL